MDPLFRRERISTFDNAIHVSDGIAHCLAMGRGDCIESAFALYVLNSYIIVIFDINTQNAGRGNLPESTLASRKELNFGCLGKRGRRTDRLLAQVA